MDVGSKNARQIFLAAVKLAPDEREAYLAEACGGDEQLRQRVAVLLKSHEEIGSFLTAHGEMTSAMESADPLPRFSEGTQVGPYKLLQQIGEGGMGVVYMAEQQKPVRRRVALKIIKPGMDSRQVIARFEAERQALAMMDHPNIARVLDAGCTESGRPYFAMELVQGIPITQYCDDRQLPPEERLELFIEVCHAVQHAHQKGIIHRDLKPSNVLIAIFDGKPIPKIIDFGVAKALHQQLTEKTVFTQFGAVVGTLEYMSPEQAEMDLVGTDTRSDIYSLGVLLYELLTGSTPMDGKKLRSLGYAEMLRTIREVDPPKPSTRLSQSQHDLANISAKRHTEPRRLQKLIAGDLDWIVMKCLEKDRDRRYETANGLALDIQRHLQDEAVSASPPGQFYKLQKMVRRNKLACTAAASVMLALMLGMAASLWEAGRANREAERAQNEAARAQTEEARAQNEAARAQQEAERANVALKDLQATAPSIAAEARALAAQEKFDEAIGKLEYAAKLRPDAPEYLLAKADLLETQMRLAEAAAVYRAALSLKPDDARARENAELCEQLAAAPKNGDGKLSRESFAKLSAQMTKDQRPAAEIMPVARLLGDEKKHIVDYWLERLKDLPNGTETPLEKRLTVGEDGLLVLDLENTKISNLSMLEGMPLGKLDLNDCHDVKNILPLHGMPLKELDISNTGVYDISSVREFTGLEKLELYGVNISDLSPLRGLRLRHLEIGFTTVADLTPLAGMPIKHLNASRIPALDFSMLAGMPLEFCILQGTRVRDLGFLRGAPLKLLGLNGCGEIRNLKVLSSIATLETLALPTNFAELPAEEVAAIEALRTHPGLKQIAADYMMGMDFSTTQSKEAFWKDWDQMQAFATPLKKAGIVFTRTKQLDGTWAVRIRNQPLHDLTPLANAPISWLDLFGCKASDLAPLKTLPLTHLDLGEVPVADLTPLSGMKLEWLSLFQTEVQDLSPLQGMPLKQLDLRNLDKQVDFGPLSECTALENIFLSVHAADLTTLKKLPNLKRISFSDTQGHPTCTAEAFWKTWDGLPWARKLEAAGISFTFEQTEDGFYDVRIHDPKFTDCSIFKGSNIRRLDLMRSGVADLKPLAELPLAHLDVRDTSVTDLSPLRSPVLRDALREIQLWKCKVTDFSPIADCKNLELFDASDTALADLSVVKGLKLHKLWIARTGVTDLSLVAGMPLEGILLIGLKVTDISPLLKCPTLKSIVLPQGAHDVESLHALPNLARLSYVQNEQVEADKTAEQFWEMRQVEESWVAALRKANINCKASRLADKSWSLTLDDELVADLSPIKGANITRLSAMRTSVTDLTPLAGMKLTELWLSGSKVTDLTPIKGMPITSMNVSGTHVRDLSPLAGMPLVNIFMTNCEEITDLSPLAGMGSTLEKVILPKNPGNIEFLRAFPNLRRISFKFEGNAKGPSMSAAEFWAEYDRAKSAAAQ